MKAMFISDMNTFSAHSLSYYYRDHYLVKCTCLVKTLSRYSTVCQKVGNAEKKSISSLKTL